MFDNDDFEDDVGSIPLTVEDWMKYSDELTEKLTEARAEIGILNNAIVMLKQQLDRHEIRYFEDGYIPLGKKPSKMSKEELKVRAKQAFSRVKQKADSEEKLKMPTFEEEAKYVSEDKKKVMNEQDIAKLALGVLINQIKQQS